MFIRRGITKVRLSKYDTARTLKYTYMTPFKFGLINVIKVVMLLKSPKIARPIPMMRNET